MIIVDTDAFSHIHQRTSVGLAIEARLELSPDRDVRFTVVTACEMLGGAISLIDRRSKERKDVIWPFGLLEGSVRFLGGRRDQILAYDADAERVYQRFPARLRQELKDDARIAAVALVHGASIWTCNVSDHAKVPGLILFDARTGRNDP